MSQPLSGMQKGHVCADMVITLAVQQWDVFRGYQRTVWVRMYVQ